MLRNRKNKLYKEPPLDEETDCERKFDLAEPLKSERFDQVKDRHLIQLSGAQMNLQMIQRNGFDKPILIVSPEGLDLRVPPKSFLVRDVRNYVGPQRMIDVMDVKTQKNIEMSMKDFCKYYESKHRDKLLNVISLEFSHTDLDELVESPMIVRLLDWVDLVWPKALKESQTDSTNVITQMKYPKVQKYCLMSVKGSYTDFHIDFGGTSVWYHIIRGRKVFWMVPPTELNLQVFEDWTLSGMQQHVFFGDTVEDCFRVELEAGNTFFIPSGWIHAVYTLEDSLVFGGNFLHSFSIENQLRVFKIEDATKVPAKFRYPFYTELLWYVVQHYVHCLTGHDHLHKIDIRVDEKPKIECQKSEVVPLISHDDSTETECDDQVQADVSKSKSRKKISPKQRRARTRAKGKPTKRRKKSPESDEETEVDSKPEDDESETDLDSPNEDLSASKKHITPTTTCRMTKNSLSRLQFDITPDVTISPKAELNSKQSNKPGKSNKKEQSDIRNKHKRSHCDIFHDQSNKTVDQNSSTNISKDQENQSNTTSANTTERDQSPEPCQSQSSKMNLADMMLAANESQMNGWTYGSGGHSIWTNPMKTQKELEEQKRIHLTRFEISGLKALVKHLSKLSGAKKNLPSLIRNSRVLLDDCRKVLVEHENDNPELAITGKPITLESMKNTKMDMNDLIAQFFKHGNNQELSAEDENLANSALSSQAKASTNSATTMIRFPSTTNPSGKMSKFSNKPCENSKSNSAPKNPTSSISSDPKVKSETKDPVPNKRGNRAHGASGTSTTHTTPDSTNLIEDDTSKLHSPKKSSSQQLTSVGTSSTRPASPPTRPISNNQYKAKNDNDLMLPGSFADLIAATSTDKKVYDISGTEVVKLNQSPTKRTTKVNTDNKPVGLPNLDAPVALPPIIPPPTSNKTYHTQHMPITPAIGTPRHPSAQKNPQPQLNNPYPAHNTITNHHNQPHINQQQQTNHQRYHQQHQIYSKQLQQSQPAPFTNQLSSQPIHQPSRYQPLLHPPNNPTPSAQSVLHQPHVTSNVVWSSSNQKTIQQPSASSLDLVASPAHNQQLSPTLANTAYKPTPSSNVQVINQPQESVRINKPPPPTSRQSPSDFDQNGQSAQTSQTQIRNHDSSMSHHAVKPQKSKSTHQVTPKSSNDAAPGVPIIALAPHKRNSKSSTPSSNNRKTSEMLHRLSNEHSGSSMSNSQPIFMASTSGPNLNEQSKVPSATPAHSDTRTSSSPALGTSQHVPKTTTPNKQAINQTMPIAVVSGIPTILTSIATHNQNKPTTTVAPICNPVAAHSGTSFLPRIPVITRVQTSNANQIPTNLSNVQPLNLNMMPRIPFIPVTTGPNGVRAFIPASHAALLPAHLNLPSRQTKIDSSGTTRAANSSSAAIPTSSVRFDNTALLSLATTALSTAPSMINSGQFNPMTSTRPMGQINPSVLDASHRPDMTGPSIGLGISATSASQPAFLMNRGAPSNFSIPGMGTPLRATLALRPTTSQTVPAAPGVNYLTGQPMLNPFLQRMPLGGQLNGQPPIVYLLPPYGGLWMNNRARST